MMNSKHCSVTSEVHQFISKMIPGPHHHSYTDNSANQAPILHLMSQYAPRPPTPVGYSPFNITWDMESQEPPQFQLLQPGFSSAERINEVKHGQLEFDRSPSDTRITQVGLETQPVAKGSRYKYARIPDERKTEKYWAMRKQNNIAAKRSRDAKQLRDDQNLKRLRFLEDENHILKKKLQEMEQITRENDALKEEIRRFRAAASAGAEFLQLQTKRGTIYYHYENIKLEEGSTS